MPFDHSHYAATPLKKFRRSLELAPRYYLRDLPRYIRHRHLLGLPMVDLAALVNPVGELIPVSRPRFELPPGFGTALGDFARVGVTITIPPPRLGALAGAWWSTRSVEGDVVECGAYRGATSLFLALLGAINDVSQAVYALDTFGGMPPPSQFDPSRSAGEFTPSDGQVELIHLQAAALGIGSRLRVEPGRFDESFPALGQGGQLRNIAFAHIDCNLYESTRQACEFVYPRIPPGGVVVFDDYNGVCDLGARLAVEEFRGSKGVGLRRLCGSSAYLIKEG
jgi:hypothetical protein